MDKAWIKNSFRKSILSYDDHATVQQKICFELIKRMPPNSFQKVYEIGAGTGFLTRLLLDHVQIGEYIVNDLVEEVKPGIGTIMEERKFTRWSFLSGDAEMLDPPVHTDLVISGSTLQWFKHPEVFFEKLFDCMAPGGLLVFNTFGKKNFIENTSITGSGLPYFNKEEMDSLLQQHFELLESREEIIRLKFDTPSSVLQHFKKTGVNGLTNARWTKTMLEEYIFSYKQMFAFEDGVSLTYHPMYFVARKK